MNKILFYIFIFLVISGKSQTQEPLIIDDSNLFNEYCSKFIKFENKILFSYSVDRHDYVNGYHQGIEHQILMDDCGNILKSKILDSTEYVGYNVLMGCYHRLNDKLYQFGTLVSYDSKQYRILLRISDLQLNLIKDTIIHYEHQFVNFKDVFYDSNYFFSSVVVYNAIDSMQYSGVFRMDTLLNIIDTMNFKMPFCFYYDNINVFNTSDTAFQLRFSSNRMACLALGINKYNMNQKDTLFDQSIEGYWFTTAMIKHDSNTFVEPLTAGWIAYNNTDSIYNLVGWSIWDRNSTLLDTVFLETKPIQFDYCGRYKTIDFIGSDSLVMGYLHNCDLSENYSDSLYIGVLYSDLLGNVRKRVFFGGDYRYNVENVVRFDNGNVLVMSTREIKFKPSTNQTIGFVLWLLDADGNLIQKIELPEIPKSSLRVFPNPAREIIQLLTSENQPIQQVEIFDTSGKLLKIVKDKTGIQSLTISDLPKDCI